MFDIFYHKIIQCFTLLVITWMLFCTLYIMQIVRFIVSMVIHITSNFYCDIASVHADRINGRKVHVKKEKCSFKTSRKKEKKSLRKVAHSLVWLKRFEIGAKQVKIIISTLSRKREMLCWRLSDFLRNIWRKLRELFIVFSAWRGASCTGRCATITAKVTQTRRHNFQSGAKSFCVVLT